jgi:DNA-directed RNA polymerase subunit RPC12/RpoP
MTIPEVCVECFADINPEDEMLPDYPGLYQCPECGHPHGSK